MANSRICSVDGCGKKLFCKGLCRTHYNKHRQSRPTKECYVDGCRNFSVSKGMCETHYRRNLKHGDIEYTRAREAQEKIDRFIEDAIKYKGDDCLIWPSDAGTPKLIIYNNRKGVNASRYMCQRVHGTPPTPKHECAHSCGRGHLGCVNPNHLRWATASENQMDRLIHGTDSRGEKHPKNILTRDEVREIRSATKGRESFSSIADRYGISKSTVAGIKHRRIWRWLD